MRVAYLVGLEVGLSGLSGGRDGMLYLSRLEWCGDRKNRLGEPALDLGLFGLTLRCRGLL